MAHTILVAFCVTGCDSFEEAQRELLPRLPAPEYQPPGCKAVIDSWWVAEDDVDPMAENDCDSAVFVDRGEQERATALLRAAGLQHG